MQDASLQESFKVSEWMRRLSLPSVFRACAVLCVCPLSASNEVCSVRLPPAERQLLACVATEP